MDLRLIAQDDSTLTLGWDPVAGAVGYRFTSEKQARPSHTWNAARNTVKFSKGSAWYRVEALAVTDSGQYPAPAAAPLFDGRATRMRSLVGSTLAMGAGSNASQSPAVWGEKPGTPSGLYFMQRNGVNDVTVVDDPLFGRVYKFTIGQGSTNPYLTLNSDGRASGELTKERPITPGQTDWYADAYQIVSPWHMPPNSPFCVLSQYGYPTIYSPPLSVCLDNNGLGVDRHVGAYSSGKIQYALKPRFYTLAEIQDKWLELVIGVTWQFDTNGSIEVWGRIRGVDSNFVLKYSDTTHPTNQYVPGQGSKTTVNDKHGLYLGRFPVGSIQENVVYHRGFTRSASMADAVATFR